MIESVSAQNISDGVSKRQLEYLSSEGDTIISAWEWVPAPEAGAQPPRAILQIAHGMVEFIDRYDEYARVLAKAGIIVVGNDHIGHGDSVFSQKQWGELPYKNGADVLVADVHKLRELAQKRHGAELPYFVQGHSMGSFIIRKYITEHGEGLFGAIIEGTGNPSTSLSAAGKMVCSVLSAFKGKQGRSKTVDNMVLGAYSKAVPNAKTPADWISTDEEVVNRYVNEPRNTFTFTLGGYKTLLSMTSEVARQESVNRIPKGLPILIESGDGDPVGEMGKAPKALYDMCMAAGIEDVTLKIYEGARHEVHNEFCKEQFYADNIAWIASHLQ
ncbi:MAG: lysophospholipase [bacterium]|nr:lysophospholipase [bacterium]